MAPKRATKPKVEKEIVDDAEAIVNDVPAGKKKGGKAVKIAPEKPVEEAPVEAVKNGTGKKGKKAEEEDNSDDAPISDAKSPAKRGRKAKAESQPPSKKAKNDEEDDEEPKEPEIKGRRGRKPAAPAPAKKEEKKVAKPKKGKEVEESQPSEEEPEEDQDEAKQPAKRGRKKGSAKETEADKPAGRRGAKDEDEPEVKKAATKTLQNKTSSEFDSIDYSCNKESTSGNSWNFKISSWNVDGIRAWLNKGGLEYIHHEKPDILCLQETKCSEGKLPKDVSSVEGYHAYWVSGKQEGYAGVGIYTKNTPIEVKYGLGDEKSDAEGRMITAEYEHFYLICTYVPNAGRGLVTLPKRLQWNEEFRKYVVDLDAKKPVIICGDMNVSHLEIDLANPKTNKKNAGFTQEERDGMTTLLGDGFVDTFRNLYPDKTGSYTFWTYMSNCRAKNVGWRLDYAIVSERFMPSICDNVIRSEVFGSDHCPITLFLHVDGLNKSED